MSSADLVTTKGAAADTGQRPAVVSLRRHRVLVAALLVGVTLRVLMGPEVPISATASAPVIGLQHVVGLFTAALLYGLSLRWGVAPWLAALGVLPVLADAGRLVGERGLIVPGLFLLVVSAVLLALGWRHRVGPAWLLLHVALFAALFVLTLWSPHESPAPGTGLATVPLLVLVVGCGIGLLAALGAGRARPWLGRGVAATVALVPVVVLAGSLIADQDIWGAPALVLAPVAAALGLTGLVRGRRGRGTERAQIDDVDRASLAAFADRYGTPQLGPVVLVIAAYNEAEGLPGVLSVLPETVLDQPLHVVVVDDGSTDGTAAAVQAHGRAYAVACPGNRGQGAALRLGYRIAREHGASVVMTTDADGQYDVADFPAVLAPVLTGEADFVTGSRRLGAHHSDDHVRRTGVVVFAQVVSVLTGLRMTDTSFGLRAMRAELTGRVTLNQPQYQSSELLIGAVSHGYRIREVPGTMRVRSAGSTKKGGNLIYGTRYARVVLGTWWREGCPTPATTPGRR